MRKSPLKILVTAEFAVLLQCLFGAWSCFIFPISTKKDIKTSVRAWILNVNFQDYHSIIVLMSFSGLVPD